MIEEAMEKIVADAKAWYAAGGKPMRGIFRSRDGHCCGIGAACSQREPDRMRYGVTQGVVMETMRDAYWVAARDVMFLIGAFGRGFDGEEANGIMDRFIPAYEAGRRLAEEVFGGAA